MSPKEQFIAVVANDTLCTADAIVLLEGDGLARVSYAVALYREGWAPLVVISGGLDNPPHSISASLMKREVVAQGVPEECIVLEEESKNTREQAVALATQCAERGWKRLLIVASHYHQYRAFLTFLKALEEHSLDRSVELISTPARDLPWFKEDEQGARIDLLEQEFERIELYGKKGDVSSYEEGLRYLRWKELSHD